MPWVMITLPRDSSKDARRPSISVLILVIAVALVTEHQMQYSTAINRRMTDIHATSTTTAI